MQEYKITEGELIRTFYDGEKDTAYKEGATLGRLVIRNRGIGAVFKRDDKDPMQWVFIGCFASKRRKR